MITMTATGTANFRNADGSINTDRAIQAGRKARADAIRELLVIARQVAGAILRTCSRSHLRRDLTGYTA
jgi:hypothetical protein